jgi:hypothetical protein
MPRKYRVKTIHLEYYPELNYEIDSLINIQIKPTNADSQIN